MWSHKISAIIQNATEAMRITLAGYSLLLRFFQRRFCLRIQHHQISAGEFSPFDAPAGVRLPFYI
jgi:hypothetical protein